VRTTRKLPYQQVASKSLKTAVLYANERLRPYLPETDWYQKDRLYRMLEHHGSVFIKPDKGGGGAGAIRLTKLGGGIVKCETLYERKKLPIRQISTWIERKFRPDKKYIMQQGIELARIEGRPFDLRINLQKPHKYWEITGVCAKVAAPGKIVTNHCKGGMPIELHTALQKITDGNLTEMKNLHKELHYLSIEIAKTLNTRFKGLKELGIDAGIDSDLKIWVFEVNTRPDFKMFRDLKDRSQYRRIKKIHSLIV
jgi:YheC/D like ATP-grasp